METLTYSIVKLRFFSGLHLSRGKEENFDRTQLVLHSDTLKSALFVAALQLYGEEITKESFLETFNVSSAFPFYEQENQSLYFFPKPNCSLESKIELDAKTRRLRKLLNGVRYLEKDLLEAILAQEGDQKINLTADQFSEDKSLLCQQHNLRSARILDTAHQHQVQVSRFDHQDSEPYSVDKLYFEKNAGLFFLLDGSNPKALGKVIASLRLLGDSGLGTDKSSGGGQFTFELLENAFQWPLFSSPRQMNISLYCPRRPEVTHLDQAAYRLQRRGGYIANPAKDRYLSIRKKSIYMFSEGSLFPFSQERQGYIANLAPNPDQLKSIGVTPIGHPVWRDGRALFLPTYL